MDNPRNDGGPAFPLPDWSNIPWPKGTPVNYGTGMSLRQWYAGMALQALVAKAPLLDREGEHGPKFDQETLDQFRDDMAHSAFGYADAMLKIEKERTEESTKGGCKR